jgi:hypothetical protein
VLSLHQLPITIRPADADDDAAVARLAALDSASVPTGPVLLAEVAGEAWAVVSIQNLAAVADPFRPSGPVVALVRDHIERCAPPRRQAQPRSARSLIDRLSTHSRRADVAHLEAIYALESAERCG